MAGKITDLHATVRAGTGKGAARQARRNGDVPGIIYGGGVDPLPINIPFNYLLTRLRKGRFLATLFNIKVEGEPDAHVICRTVQRDVVKDLPIHIDFLRLTDSSRVDMFLPVEFTNHEKSPGIKRGGVLVVVRSEVEFNVRADSIPEHIIVDLDGTDFGDVIHISSVSLPEGVKPVIERDFVIANISAPTVMIADEDEEAPEADEVAVVGKEDDADK